MPRACGLGIQGGIFHLTHRCHNKQHLLKFARDRDLYRQKLRQALAISNLALLDYCLTCNHVHLLVDTDDFPEVSRVMQKVAGETARAYNRRKDRINAFWGDNYHVTRESTLAGQGRTLRPRGHDPVCFRESRDGASAGPRAWEPEPPPKIGPKGPCWTFDSARSVAAQLLRSVTRAGRGSPLPEPGWGR